MGSRCTALLLVLVSGIVLFAAAAPSAHADGSTTALPTLTDIRTAIPAASFRAPRALACNKCGCDPCNPCCKRLKFSVTLVGWLTAMDGDATIRGRNVGVDISLGDVIDLLSKLDALLQGSFRADYGKWFARLGVSHLGLGDDINATVSPGPGPGVSVAGTVGITQTYFQAIVGYNVKTIAGPKTGCCCSSIRFDAFAGARWADTEVSISLPGPAATASQDWVDPIVGGIATWDLKNRWILDFEADVGGFGVNSDLTWRMRFGASYNVNRWLGIVAGYQMLDYDYTTGAGTTLFKWDVLTHGPYIGVNVRF